MLPVGNMEMVFLLPREWIFTLWTDFFKHKIKLQDQIFTATGIFTSGVDFYPVSANFYCDNQSLALYKSGHGHK